ncbi:MAG: hypothetical protein ACPG4Q_11235 [Phycisphaeraceae bacterium]
MNWEIFSLMGYVSVALWVSVPVLWLMHILLRPLRFLGHVALGCALLAFVLGEANSRYYVSRIAVDQTEVVEKEMAARELARKQAEADRAEDAADIRFAEDAAGDRLDKAGLDDTDLAYFESFGEDAPDWKKEKQTRDENAGEDDDLEAMIGGTTERDGVDAGDVVQEAEQREPIYLSEKDMLAANRLDKTNLTATQVVLFLAALFVVVDYVRRLNVYREAYFPLPVPSAWADALTERPAVASHPDKPRRSLIEELQFITRRGEVFIHFTCDPSVADQVSTELPRLPGGLWPIRVVDLEQEDGLDDRFVFETLWFGRNSFVLQDGERAIQLLEGFVHWLGLRRDVKARTRRTVHLVWDLDIEVPEPLKQRIEILGKATGFTLLLCRTPAPKEAAA